MSQRVGGCSGLAAERPIKDKTIELTIALTRGGLYLTYAKPVRKRS